MEVCEKCIGIEKCSKYCPLKVGENLVNFIKNIDTVETKIGEIQPPSGTFKANLIVSGHMIDSAPGPTYVMSETTSSIDISGKFIPYKGKTPEDIMRTYMSKLNVTPEFSKATMQEFKRYNSNKVLAVPIRPGTDCEVTVEDGGREKTMSMTLTTVKWYTDPVTKKLVCNLFFVAKKSLMFETTTKTFKVPITDYGKKFKIIPIEKTLKSSDINREAIQIIDVGFIKPIIFSDKKLTFAVDGRYIYNVLDTGDSLIIGEYDDNGEIKLTVSSDSIKRTKVYKKIKQNIDYINKHRRFIAPFGTLEPSVVEV